MSEMDALIPVYNRFPLAVTRGKGSYVWDDQGERYLDYTSGIAVCNLGHAPEYVKERLKQQLEELWHCSNLFQIPKQQELARKLVQHSCADQVFFCNSGAEANEAAIKLARRYARQVLNRDAYEIVTFRQSFHGRTMATLTATGQEKVQQGFSPLVPGFRYLPYNDLSALDQLVTDKTCAVLLELVQGEGGVVPADPVWVAKLKELCEVHGYLFMVDEVQTGMGRTGTLFAYQQYGIEPDVITLAKGLGSGFPIGALLAKKEAAKAFEPGSHGSTFGGNPLAAAAGLATLEYMLENDVVGKSAKLAAELFAELQKLKEKSSFIKEIRGKGMLLGIEVNGSALDVVHKAREKKLLILTAGPNVVRILPPLTTTREEVGQFLAVMEEILPAFQGVGA